MSVALAVAIEEGGLPSRGGEALSVALAVAVEDSAPEPTASS